MEEHFTSDVKVLITNWEAQDVEMEESGMNKEDPQHISRIRCMALESGVFVLAFWGRASGHFLTKISALAR